MSIMRTLLAFGGLWIPPKLLVSPGQSSAGLCGGPEKGPFPASCHWALVNCAMSPWLSPLIQNATRSLTVVIPSVPGLQSPSRHLHLE